MGDVAELTKSLGDVVLGASEEDELVSPTIVLESFTNALANSRDPIVREAFLEACHDVLMPRGDEQDKGRLAVLHDAALTCVPAILPLVCTAEARATRMLGLIADHADPREVLLALNGELDRLGELAEPFSVSDDEGSDVEDDALDWDVAFPQLEQILEMYATAIGRLKIRRSTPTLLALRDALLPLITAIPATAPGSMVRPMSRALLPRIARVADSAWSWCQTTTDANGEQKSILMELIQLAVVIFGPGQEAEMAARWFLVSSPQFLAMHPEIAGPGHHDWTDGQAALDAAREAVYKLGMDQAALVDNITSTSSIKPHASIASLILFASALPRQEDSSGIFGRSKTVLFDAMPVLSGAIASSALDAGATVAWALTHAAALGEVTMEVDQASMLLELVMPHVESVPSKAMRFALAKLLGAIIMATPGLDNRVELLKQLVEPANPFGAIRVYAVNMVRDLCVSATGESLLHRKLLTELGPILFTLPPAALDTPLDELLQTMLPAWLTECANMVYFLLERDRTNATGIADAAYLASVRDGFVAPLGARTGDWLKASPDPLATLVIDRMADALGRAREAMDQSLAAGGGPLAPPAPGSTPLPPLAAAGK